MADGGRSLADGHPPPLLLRWVVGVVFSVVAGAFVGLSLWFLYRIVGREALVAVAAFGTVLAVIGVAASRLKPRGEAKARQAAAGSRPEGAAASSVIIEVPEGSKVEVSPTQPETGQPAKRDRSRRFADWAVTAGGLGLAAGSAALLASAWRTTDASPAAIIAVSAALPFALLGFRALAWRLERRSVDLMKEHGYEARITLDAGTEIRIREQREEPEEEEDRGA